MGYRNKTYVIFDGDNDMWAYAFMKGWKQNEHVDFDFHDAHALNKLMDWSSENTVKGKLRERFASTKQAIVLIGENTKNLYKYVRWELETCLKLDLPIVAVNLNNKRQMDDDRCPPILKGKPVVHVAFKMKIIRHALDEFCEEYGSAYLSLLIVATIWTLIGVQSATFAVLQALTLMGALGCSIYLSALRPDRYWYGARAVAESIKTVSWRFMTRSEPFQSSDEVDCSHFRNILKSVVEQNRAIAERLTSHLERPQITEGMMAVRQASLSIRLATYVTHRIVDQHTWYAKKAAYNRRMADRLFAALVIANAAAVVFAVARIMYPVAPYWPTDVLVASAAALLTWIQAKRFSELSASYTLAVHEISLIREQSAQIKTDTDLSHFVGDAENAFSREHTQWIARKDT